MTNEEKAREISDGYDYTFDKRERDASYHSALEIAEWKDKEFKEYLEKKREENPYFNIQMNMIRQNAIDAIINELFKED